ncbi:MAG TPA: glycosyltransferase family 4 protein [Xanthobacteraceae bacterium]|nr:glycosyltransferase family 4 protein [Xanthobacteraceae bacterium]
MQLLIVSAYFDSHRGGIEIVAGRLAQEFRRAGHAVTWLASSAGYSGPSGEPGDRRVAVPAFNGLEHVLGLPVPIPAPTALGAIRREVERADVVVLHDCLYPTNVAAFLLARRCGKPVVVTQHIGIVPYRNALLRGLMTLLTRVVTRPMLAAADQVIFISGITASAFADVRCQRPPRLIFNGVDTQTFRPAGDAEERAALRAQLGLPSHRPVALFVGRFVEKKGLHILHEAARRAGDVIWAFAGWGKLDPRQWGLPNVRVYSGLAGPSLAPLYRASDVFVLPSTGEGFPLALQEAVACGVPVVCGADTAQADQRLTALLHPVTIDTRDAPAIAGDVVQAVAAAMADDRRARLAEAAGWYSWSRAGRLHLELIGAVASRAAALSPGMVRSSLSRAGADR